MWVLGSDPARLLRLLEHADQASMDELQAGMVEARDVLLSHKYAKPLHVDITIQPAGEEGKGRRGRAVQEGIPWG